jgi:hypothetical protein
LVRNRRQRPRPRANRHNQSDIISQLRPDIRLLRAETW